MKLSEAIRKGAQIRPQGFGLMFEYSRDSLCSCSLGAAYEALVREQGETPTEAELRPLITRTALARMKQAWVELGRRVLGSAGQDVTGEIIHLNDNKGLSREEIADRVEAWGY